MITEATIQRARYYPERLPDARVVTVAAGLEASPPLLDLRRFAPKFLHLRDLAVEQNANVELRVRADDLRYEFSCAGYPNLTPAAWELIGTEFLRSVLYGYTGAGTGISVRVYFNLWVYEATVAHKLKHRKILSAEEQRIADQLGIRASVEKGVLPLPLDYMVQREYHVLEEISYTRVLSVGTTPSTVVSLSPRPDEFLVLTGLASQPGNLADNVTVTIDRDDNAAYLSVPTYPLSLDRDLPCFVPALNELRISVSAGGNVASHALRFTVRRCRLTNTLRVRFGLVSRDEVPGDLWDKVKGGVL